MINCVGLRANDSVLRRNVSFVALDLQVLRCCLPQFDYDM